MKRKVRWVSLVLIICFLLPTISFGASYDPSADETYVNNFLVVIPRGYDFNMSLISDMQLSKPINLRLAFGEKLRNSTLKHKVEIHLSKGADRVAGDFKFDLDASIDHKDISILIQEYGQYDIAIDIDNQLLIKEYSIILQERWATFGAKLNAPLSPEEVIQFEEVIITKSPEKTSTISISDIDISLSPIKESTSNAMIHSPDEIMLDVGEITIINQIPKEPSFSIKGSFNNRKIFIRNIQDLIALPYTLTSYSLLSHMKILAIE